MKFTSIFFLRVKVSSIYQRYKKEALFAECLWLFFIKSKILEHISSRNLPSLVLGTARCIDIFPLEAITHRDLISYT